MVLGFLFLRLILFRTWLMILGLMPLRDTSLSWPWKLQSSRPSVKFKSAWKYCQIDVFCEGTNCSTDGGRSARTPQEVNWRIPICSFVQMPFLSAVQPYYWIFSVARAKIMSLTQWV